jgi:hypothetical protein
MVVPSCFVTKALPDGMSKLTHVPVLLVWYLVSVVSLCQLQDSTVILSESRS